MRADRRASPGGTRDRPPALASRATLACRATARRGSHRGGSRDEGLHERAVSRAASAGPRGVGLLPRCCAAANEVRGRSAQLACASASHAAAVGASSRRSQRANEVEAERHRQIGSASGRRPSTSPSAPLRRWKAERAERALTPDAVVLLSPSAELPERAPRSRRCRRCRRGASRAGPRPRSESREFRRARPRTSPGEAMSGIGPGVFVIAKPAPHIMETTKPPPFSWSSIWEATRPGPPHLEARDGDHRDRCRARGLVDVEAGRRPRPFMRSPSGIRL